MHTLLLAQVVTQQLLIYTGFSALILIAALAMLSLHLRTWRQRERSNLGEAEYAFAAAQYRRRMKTSGMLVSLAIFIFLGQFVRSPLMQLFYWFGILIMLIWIVCLALIDMVSTNRYYSRLTHQNQVEQARLRAQIRRMDDGPDNRTN